MPKKERRIRLAREHSLSLLRAESMKTRMCRVSLSLLTLVCVSLWGAVLFWVSAANAANIACVGDSITYGYGLSEPSTESYPAVLQELLGPDHTVGNFGVSGATLLKAGDRPYWNESRYADSDAFAPDVVVIMLGTNDAKPQNWANSGAFSSDYHELIDHYRALGAKVYIATPPTVFEPGAFDIPPGVLAGEVVPLVEQIATEAGAPLVDVFSATESSGSLFPDTVHPDAAGARLLAETVQAALVLHDFDAPEPVGMGGNGNQTQGAGGSATTGAGGAATGVGGAAAQTSATSSATVSAGGASVSTGGTTLNTSGSGAASTTTTAASDSSATVSVATTTGGDASAVTGSVSGGSSPAQGAAQTTDGVPGGVDGSSASAGNQGCGCRIVSGKSPWESRIVAALLMMLTALGTRRHSP